MAKRAVKVTEEPKGYNGWTNYESWCLALWLDNEEPSYRYWREQAKECLAEAREVPGRRGNKVKEAAATDLAGRLKDETEDARPTGFTNASGEIVAEGFWSDMLGAALSEVNWYEIAEHLLEE